MHRFARLAFTFSFLLLVPGCSSDGTNGLPGPGAVNVDDNLFNPAAISVSTGTTVTWTWIGNNLHNVTWAEPNPPAPAPTQNSGTYQRVFNAAGTFNYYCSIHGSPTGGMRGSVTVQ